MADFELPDKNDTLCWQCGASADAKYAYSFLLVAKSGNKLDASGYTVKRGTQEDRLRIPVPRCIDCRSRNRRSVAIVFGSMIAGAITAGIFRALVWPHYGENGLVGSASGIGAVLGCAAALLGIALFRRSSGIRPLNAYPPVVALRNAGWQYPP